MTSFKHASVTLSVNQLEAYFRKAWDVCWKEVSSGKLRQDYVTASDIESAVRFLVDKDNGEAVGYSGWWGYQGWCRISVRDGSRGSLLDKSRDFLASLIREGKIEGHNFGRGHCSGMRFRPVGTGLNEAEQKTIKAKKKEKPVHFAYEDGYTSSPLCTKDRKKPGTYSYRHRSRFNPKGPRTTSDVEKVTCPRCRKLIEAANKAMK